MPTAILDDAALFLRRLPRIWPSPIEPEPAEVARRLCDTALGHLSQPSAGNVIRRDLYRIHIGIDICSLTLKGEVDQIVLISGGRKFRTCGQAGEA